MRSQRCDRWPPQSFVVASSRPAPPLCCSRGAESRPRSSQSLAIQRATHSPYSHMGLVLYRDGRAFVLEAVATVRYTPLAEWIDRGVGRHFVVRRLRDWPE